MRDVRQYAARRHGRLAALYRMTFGAGLLIVGCGIAVAAHAESRLRADARLATSVRATHVTAAPSTVKQSEDQFDAYRVPPDAPRYLRIPKLNTRAMVRALGLTKDGQVAAPTNVYDAGWFTQSGKPGMPGAVLLDGHVSSWSTPGVFYNLKALRPGDTMYIDRGDGTTLTYNVVTSKAYNADSVDMAAALQPVDAGSPGLNLITCTGNVVRGTNTYSQRLVVFAKQM